MTDTIKKEYDSMIKALYKHYLTEFDPKERLLGYNVKNQAVIHTRVTGFLHNINGNAIFARTIYQCEDEESYPLAEEIIRKVIDAQDKDPDSKTYGLWGYYFEEPLSQMSPPDYNMAEFVSASLIYIIMEKADKISESLKNDIIRALHRAGSCCIKRNVGIDYTNVICMSIFSIITIGEITGDNDMIQVGKHELDAFLEYTRFNGGFSEYNSPCYCKIAGDAICRMMKYFKDIECRRAAVELNGYLWDMVSRHYSASFGEFSPPFVRVYDEIDSNNESRNFIYYATNGKYGKYTGMVSSSFFNIPECPEEYLDNFGKKAFMRDTYYKKNDLRDRHTDATIVRDFDSPDLVAVSNKNDHFLMGALEKTELWVQRRSSMIIWDKDNPKCVKLRCVKDGFDFSSGMAYTSMNENSFISVLGFANDHGIKHYILDLFKDGKFNASSLKFAFDFGVNSENCRFIRKGNSFTYKDEKIEINVDIIKWIYDGKPGEIRLGEHGIEMICFEGNEREVDLNSLKDSFGIISVGIFEKPAEAKINENEDIVEVSSDKSFIRAYKTPKSYNECMRNSFVKNI